MVGATETKNYGIIGEGADLNLVHTSDVRPSQVLYELVSHLVLTGWREPGEEPKLYLFGQLKRITREWLEGYLVCKGGTYPAQLKYKTLANMACEKIKAGISRAFVGQRPILATLDPYNPIGSTMHVNFNTSKTDCWRTDARRSHINWAVLDSSWEAEFCRVAESHPRVRSYVKNHSLGFEVPYRFGSEMRNYRPDFIVNVEDGHGEEDLLHLVVEIKGYRGEDAKEKKSTMDTYWVPAVNHAGQYGRWAFAEFTEVYEIESDFKAKVEAEFAKWIEVVSDKTSTLFTQAKNNSELSIVSHFGNYKPNMIKFNHEIWKIIEKSPNQILRLSDINAAAQEVSCDIDEALAVLSLLSSRSLNYLNMEMRSSRDNGAQISQSEFTQKLSGWWREKLIPDEEWKKWASAIEVRWILAIPRQEK